MIDTHAVAKKRFKRSQTEISTLAKGSVKGFDKVINDKSAVLHTHTPSSAKTSIYWDLNDVAIYKRVIKIKLEKDGEVLEALVSAEELEHYLRAT